MALLTTRVKMRIIRVLRMAVELNLGPTGRCDGYKGKLRTE